jgi:N-acyl-D-amino-acid deacylase
MFDLLIRDATVVDGTGQAGFRADVAVEGQNIAAVGQLGVAESRETFSGAGLVVSPGFIDLHAHSDLALLKEPGHLPKIMQGVTTDAFSSCGLGFAPLTPGNKSAIKSLYAPIFGATEDMAWGWESIADFMDLLDGTTSVNSAYFAGHGPIRLAVMGTENRAPTAHELDLMGGMVGEAMDRGAVGMSCGLAYTPMIFSGHDELVALTREVAKRDGIFSIHMRSYGPEIEQAVEEAVAVCEESGSRLQISHYMVTGTLNFGRAEELLTWIDKASERGVDVTFDAYPYTAGSTVVSMALPGWAQEGEPDQILARLQNSETRPCILTDMRADRYMDWNYSVIAAVKTSKNRHLEGVKVTDAATAAGKDVHEFVLDLLGDEDLEVAHIIHLGSEPDMRVIMRHPAHSFGSDGLHVEGKPHPRLYGCFPRVLGRYVRQDGVLTLEQAIHKMTGHNARRLGLTDRGVVEAGKAADLVVFDPDTIIDNATYDDPRRYPDGIRLVMVNGRLVVRDGEYSGEKPGRVLR